MISLEPSDGDEVSSREMRKTSQIMDYEPLTRSGSAKGQTEEHDGYESHAGLSGKEPGLASGELDVVPGQASSKPGAQQKRDHAFLKRGHALSVFGLFLFTFVLYFRPYELSPSLKFLTNSAFWIALFTLIIYLPTQLGLEGNLTVRPREINLALLLAVAGLFSIPFATDPLVAWAGFIDYLKVIVMLVVMVNVVRTEKRLRALILLALVASCVTSLAAVNDYRLGRLVLGQRERIEGLIGNLFDNPNDLALHLVTMIPIVVALLLATRSLSKKLVYLACVVLFSAGVIATTSRGGFIGLACVASVLAWKLARRYRVLLGAAGLVLILSMVVIGPLDFRSRMNKGNDASATARTGELKRSVFLMLHHPVFGLGINNYVLFSNTNHATHNAYTQVGSEMGIPAMLIYILFLVTPLRRLAEVRRTRLAQQRGRLYYLAIGIETSLIGYMVTSFFLSVAYLWYAYYLVGYAVALRRLAEQGLESHPAEATGQRTIPARSII